MEAQIPDGTVEELDKEAVEKGQGHCGWQVSALKEPASLSARVLQGPSTQ